MKIVSSVGLLLFDPNGRILLLRELESKLHYGKVAGMLSVPIETVEVGEVANQTLQRLLHEEIGVPINGRLSYYRRLYIKLNDAYTEMVFLYTGVCASGLVAVPTDTDIEYFGWMSPQDILSLPTGQIRIEVEPIISSYFDS